MIDGHVMKQETSEPSKVCGAETAEEKAAQEFKQRTEAGAGASDTKSVAEQVRFVTLDEKTNLPSLLLLKQYIPGRAVIPTQWPGSAQKYHDLDLKATGQLCCLTASTDSPILSSFSFFCLTWHTLHGLP